MRLIGLAVVLAVGLALAPLVEEVQPAETPLIGYLSARSPDDTAHLLTAFRQGLNENGFIEGKNVAIEYRWALGKYDRLPALAAELAHSHRYHRRVFLTPPWQELYVTDPERRHNFTTALAEYSRPLEVYPSLGYDLVVLPRVGVVERADIVLSTLAPTPASSTPGSASTASCA